MDRMDDSNQVPFQPSPRMAEAQAEIEPTPCFVMPKTILLSTVLQEEAVISSPHMRTRIVVAQENALANLPGVVGSAGATMEFKLPPTYTPAFLTAGQGVKIKSQLYLTKDNHRVLPSVSSAVASDQVLNLAKNRESPLRRDRRLGKEPVKEPAWIAPPGLIDLGSQHISAGFASQHPTALLSESDSLLLMKDIQSDSESEQQNMFSISPEEQQILRGSAASQSHLAAIPPMDTMPMSEAEQEMFDEINHNVLTHAPPNPCRLDGTWLTVLANSSTEFLIPVDALAASNIAWQERSPYGIIMPKISSQRLFNDDFAATWVDAHRFAENIVSAELGPISYAEVAMILVSVAMIKQEKDPVYFSPLVEQAHEELFAFIAKMGQAAKMLSHVRAASLRFESA
jgi:hypothetical protein